MSFDTLVWLALFAGALLLMLRFSRGAHMGHAHRHGAPNPDTAGGAGQGSLHSALSASSFKSSDAAPRRADSATQRNARRMAAADVF
jgi:hypothetical protein